MRAAAPAIALVLVAGACGTGRADLVDPGVPREVEQTTTTTTTLTVPDQAVVRLAVDEWTGDPADAGPADLGGRVIADLLFEGLTRIDSTGTVGPAIAGSWSVTADRLTWIFAITPDVVDSAGEPVTARAAMRSLDRIAARGPDDILAPTLVAITGWSDRMAGRAGGVAGITAPSPDQLVIRLDRPFEPLAEVLAWPAFGIVAGDPDELRSTGEYRVDTATGELRPVDESSSLPRIELVDPGSGTGDELIASGEADWAVLPPGSATDSLPGDVVRIPVDVHVGLAIRHNDSAVRRAISHSIDSVALATAVGLTPAPPRLSNGAVGDLPAGVAVDVPGGLLAPLGGELAGQLGAAGVAADVIVSDPETFAARVLAREALIHPVVMPGGPWSAEWMAGSLVPGAANDLIDIESVERSSLGESLTGTRDGEDRGFFAELLIQTAVDEGVFVLLGQVEVRVGVNPDAWPLRHRADGTLVLEP